MVWLQRLLRVSTESGLKRMRGSLENPPIILKHRTHKHYVFGFFLFSFGTIRGGIAVLSSETALPGSAYFFLSLFSLATLSAALLVFRAGSLLIDKGGLVYAHGLHLLRYQWDDFSRFEIDIADGRETVLGIFADNNSHGRLADESALLSDPLDSEDQTELLDLLKAANLRWRSAPSVEAVTGSS